MKISGLCAAFLLFGQVVFAQDGGKAVVDEFTKHWQSSKELSLAVAEAMPEDGEFSEGLAVSDADAANLDENAAPPAIAGAIRTASGFTRPDRANQRRRNCPNCRQACTTN